MKSQFTCVLMSRVTLHGLLVFSSSLSSIASLMSKVDFASLTFLTLASEVSMVAGGAATPHLHFSAGSQFYQIIGLRKLLKKKSSPSPS